MTQDALKLALDALEANDKLINGSGTQGGLVYCMDGYYSDCFDVDPINKQTDEAIAAIKKALAQQEQEPVVVCCQQYDTCLEPCTPRGRHLAQRTWVGLTDEEFDELDKEDLSLREFVQAVDDKLKEKNT
jgi:hypothetical protein